ncbi:MAG: TRAP transporter large permease subunit [Deltaproteobacteria bacterium]|nr:TRAP transporter large permease subunit [Deltaproteobacteria bacterium]
MEVTDFLVISMFLTFMSLLLLGIPVAYCLFGTAMAFVVVGWAADQYLGTWTGLGFNFVGLTVRRMYSVMSNWILVAIPMFIYMGLMLERSGAAERLMHSAQDIFGAIRGGLTVTTTLIGVLLAASTGIIGASVVLLGMLSLPTMLEQGYSKELATGTIAAAGTLGILIPPSIMLVIMADQLALSVGDLFLGAVFPGVILAILYVIFLLVYPLFRPEAAPLNPNRRPFSGKMALALMRDVAPPALMIVAVLGSIFAGIATVTEASGVGALAATVLALANRKLNLKVMKEVLVPTFHTVAYIMTILVGATCFALVLRGLGGDDVIERALTSLPFGPTGIVFCLLVAVFILGFFLDWIEITLIILPLVAPVVGAMDLAVDGFGVIDKPAVVWFAILVAVALQTSFLTPPVGPALFYLQGICPPEITLAHLYRGVAPFVIMQMIVLVIIFFWPDLITWLPAAVYR